MNLSKILKQNKAAGFDDLSSNFIIDAYDSLKNILFHVFKVSTKQGILRNSLKISKVTPIFKSGAEDNVSNYRPISILYVVSKVLERIMYNRVYNYLDSKAFFMKTSLVFKEITQLNMRYLLALLKKGNVHLEFL